VELEKELACPLSKELYFLKYRINIKGVGAKQKQT
jgi:hypothetical protein